MKCVEHTFDEWVEKVFAKRRPSYSWRWNNIRCPDKVEWQIIHPTRLFQAPEFLLNKYTDKQLYRGFWNLRDDWGLRDYIWDKNILWRYRRECIRAMVPLFKKLFSHNPLDDICYMWWDLFRYFGDDPDDKVINEIYLALKQILLMDSIDCQIAALHGFGHLTHPRKELVIKRYINKHLDLDPSIHRYALASIEGNVL